MAFVIKTKKNGRLHGHNIHTYMITQLLIQCCISTKHVQKMLYTQNMKLCYYNENTKPDIPNPLNHELLYVNLQRIW